MKKLLKSFYYAYEGLKFSLKSERNLRIHFCAVFYVTYFAYLAQCELYEMMILVLCFGFVITTELINTSIEVLCDKDQKGYDYFIKRSKDIASAGVFVSAITSFIIGLMVFVPKIHKLIFMTNYMHYIFLILTIPISVIFIFKRRKK